MTTPNPNDPTSGQYGRPQDAPMYVDPVTNQQLYMDPVTGQLRYEPIAGAQPPTGVTPAGPGPAPQYPYQQPYPPYQYPPYGYQYPYPAPRSTNGLAVASLITSVAGIATFFCYGIGAVAGIVGAILGHVARSKIRQTGQDGAGLALAGIIVGWIGAALGVVGVLVLVAIFQSN